MNNNIKSLKSTSLTMKAACYYKYGSAENIKIIDIERPIPKDNEVLIKIYAVSINAYDYHLMRAKPFFIRFISGLIKPKNNILGADIAGTVEYVGKSSTDFKVGDKVYGCLESCGKGGLAAGGFAEFVCSRESLLAKIPENVSFEEAAALPMAAVTALQGLNDSGNIKKGQKVLINGASGGVGTYAVQIAKALGAEVTGVCNTDCVELIYTLGADHVIDYSKEDIKKVKNKFDLVVDIAANLKIFDYKSLLINSGICIVIGFSNIRNMINIILFGKKLFKKENKKIEVLHANNTKKSDLIKLNKLYESGKIKSVIDKTFTLTNIQDAIKCLEFNHPKGKVVVKIIN